MNSIVSNYHANLLNKRQFHLNSSSSANQSDSDFINYNKNKKIIYYSREYYAASKIASIIRGFLSRKYYKKLLNYHKKAILIQKIIRQFLSKKKYQKKLWQKTSVVHSEVALKDIIERSFLIKEKINKKEKNKPNTKSTSASTFFPSYHWQEYFDPITQSFWYYNKLTGQNTWNMPIYFQHELVCHWDGFIEYGGLPAVYRDQIPERNNEKKETILGNNIENSVHNNKNLSTISLSNNFLVSVQPCRCVFKSRKDYYNHLIKEHKWYCQACLSKNYGISFPNCTTCGNTYDIKGNDGELIIKEKIEKINNDLKKFLYDDIMKNNKNYENYNIYDRIIELFYQKENNFYNQKKLKNVIENNNSKNENSTENYLNNGVKSSKDEEILNIPTVSPTQIDINSSLKEKNNDVNAIKNSNFKENNKNFLTISNGIFTQDQYNFIVYQQDVSEGTNSLDNIVNFYKNNIVTVSDEEDEDEEPEEAESIENNKEVDEKEKNDKLVSLDKTNYLVNKKNNKKSNENNLINHKSSKQIEKIKKKKDKITKLNLCYKFFNSQCTSSTCLLAHPGIRDNATIYQSKKKKNLPSQASNFSSSESSYVLLCSSNFPSSPEDNPMRLQATSDIYSYSPNINSKGLSSPILLKSDNNFKKDKDKLKGGISSPSGNSLYTSSSSINQSYSLCYCPNGVSCTYYHIYIRPSTEMLIKNIYPILKGYNEKIYNNNIILRGKIMKDTINGYAVMIWPKQKEKKNEKKLKNDNKKDEKNVSIESNIEANLDEFNEEEDEVEAVYMGDWQDGLRNGFGIYRTHKGEEYCGQYKKGIRHGWGISLTSNGDEYIGQWFEGKREGIGYLKCANGDVYRGEFKNNLYNGLGYYIKHSQEDSFGNVYKENNCFYLGYFLNGKSNGIGILKNFDYMYKGHFSNNNKHGKGIEKKKNYLYYGNYYNNLYEGFGVLIINNEKYIGQFKSNKKNGIGKIFFNNGEFFDGEFKNDKANGLGIYYHNNGNIYKGNWTNDQRNGYGTYLFSNGSKYIGNWINNNIHNKGRFYFSNGSTYFGQFNFNTKQGKGIFTWPNGTIYRGEFHNEKICGIGEIFFINGHYYKGHWKDNKKNGFGIMIYNNNSKYEGYFLNDLRHGKGKLTLNYDTSLEEYYDGDWKDDCWHGKGKYLYKKNITSALEESSSKKANGKIVLNDPMNPYDTPFNMAKLKASILESFNNANETNLKLKNEEDYDEDGELDENTKEDKKDSSSSSSNNLTSNDFYYEGDWEWNKREGYGILYFPDGSYYKGDFRQDQMWGKGIYVSPSTESQYDGEWRANMRQGIGTSIDSEGNIYHGEFVANMKHGKGELIRPDGSIYRGEWEANMIVGRGQMTITVGKLDGPDDGLPKKIKLKVLGY